MIIVLLMESEILKMKLMKSLNLKDKFLKLPDHSGRLGHRSQPLSSWLVQLQKKVAGSTLNRPVGLDNPDFTETSRRNKSACTAGADQKSERNRRRQRYGRRQHHGCYTVV